MAFRWDRGGAFGGFEAASRRSKFKVQGYRFAGFKVQKTLNRQDGQGREERQLFAVLWILCVLERAQRAGGENKQAVLCDLRAFKSSTTLLPGDYVEMEVEASQVVLKPRKLIDPNQTIGTHDILARES
jgi:hypothetical protein